MDLIEELGELALGSRLKRLVRHTDRDISRVYQDLGADFKASWFPVVALLRRESPLAIAVIAEALQLTHTAAQKFTHELVDAGLVLIGSDPSDKRKRTVQLSPQGERVIRQLEPVWEAIRAAADEALHSSRPALLAALGAYEAQLAKRGMYERIHEHLRPWLLEQVELHDYRPSLKKHFEALNREWLEALFGVEPADEAFLSDPNGKIIKRGGAVLFASLNRDIVGTCALLKHDSGVFELAKMAVLKSHRRRQVGRKLVQGILERADALGASVVYLETHPKPVDAVHFYRSLNFRETSDSPFPAKFARKRIVMKIELKGASRKRS